MDEKNVAMLMVLFVCMRIFYMPVFAQEDVMDAEKLTEENITSLDDLYGQDVRLYLGIDLNEIVKFVLEGYYGANRNNIVLTNKVYLYDANNINTYVGYNYCVNNQDIGYITIATHTKTILIKEIQENIILPEKIVCLEINIKVRK